MFNQNTSVLDWNHKTGASLGAIALGLSTLLLPGCTTGNEEIQQGRTNATTEDVADNTANLIGKEITVRSEVEQAVGNSGFVLEANEADGSQPILVINSTGTPFVLPGEGIPIQATGEVAQFVTADVEQQYGLDLEENLYVDYENRPAIIAKSLALAPTPEDLYEAPAGYFDKTIAVEGDLRKLEATPNAFALFEEGWVDDIGVLVVAANPTVQTKGVPLQEGENVTVTGVARQFSAQLVQEAGLGWDAQQIQEFESRYTNRPVIVADHVYPSAVDPAPGE
ncbi:hypothetical protein [Lyngbya aestuarii]|uniref:hypothetical protein n=1 Tax=Lyngbya aestuarii TaxID=118322 RepID=UPI00403DF1D5